MLPIILNVLKKYFTSILKNVNHAFKIFKHVHKMFPMYTQKSNEYEKSRHKNKFLKLLTIYLRNIKHVYIFPDAYKKI